MVPRASVLEPKRVQSVFKDRIERHKEEIEELEELEKMVEEEIPPNVAWENNEASADPQNVYYEQVTLSQVHWDQTYLEREFSLGPFWQKKWLLLLAILKHL